VTIETAPAFLRGLKQLENHRERRPVGQATLGSDQWDWSSADVYGVSAGKS
jgi:hypothetical protein